MVRCELNGRTYVDNEITQLLGAAIQAVGNGQMHKGAGVEIALSVVEQLPKGLGWNVIQALMLICTPRVYLAPLYQRVQKNPECFAEFAEYLAGMTKGTDYEMALLSNYVDENSCLNIEALDALIACLTDSRPTVSKSAKAVFRRIKKEGVRWEAAPQNIEDSEAWLKWAKETDRSISQSLEQVRARLNK